MDIKSFSEFYNNYTTLDEVSSICRSCIKKKQKDYIQRNPHVYKKQREKQIERNYGISKKDKDNLFEEQNGRCAICGEFSSVLCVDHNHNTGVVRGLLCSQCNFGLGNFKDNIGVLEKAIKYLKKEEDKNCEDTKMTD